MLRETIDEERLIRRLTWRLMPLLTILFLVAFIDRQNVGFAKLQMVAALGLSEENYGFAASLFFISYLVFEIPSTLALHRFGAPAWLARIMFSWGLVTVLMGFVWSGTGFTVLRLLLGVAEAGLYPGILYTLTLWFPQRHRTRVLGIFTLGSALGNMLGALIGGPLLDLDGTFGLAGWQWVFLVTGLPPLLLTPVVLLYLPKGPEEAAFLSVEEKVWLTAQLVVEKRPDAAGGNPFAALWDGRVLGFALVYMLMSTSLYGVTYWLPTVVKGFGVSATVNGLLNAIPWALAGLMLIWLPGRLRRDGMVLRAVAVIAGFGICCFIASTLLPGNTLRFVALALGAPCLSLLYPCFWSIPPRFFTGARAAASIAAINSIGNLGGAWGQNLMPKIGAMTSSTIAPMLLPAACLTMLCIIALAARQWLGHRAA